jgi:hypothetical protein
VDTLSGYRILAERVRGRSGSGRHRRRDVHNFFVHHSTVDAEELPELSVARPLQPGFATPDFPEPPSEKRDAERRLKKMAQLGYTIQKPGKAGYVGSFQQGIASGPRRRR